MEIVEEIEGALAYDMEDTIFVAVGKNVEENKGTVFWAVRSFAGKKICLLHVHQPSHVPALSFTDGKLTCSKLKQQEAETFQGGETEKLHELLNEYLLILGQAGVQADKLWIEMDNVEKGIVEVISVYNIRWLVMGAAADKHYSEKLMELKSKKATFVCEEAPISCHIWFACNGYLIYTRVGRKDRSEREFEHPLLVLDSNLGTEQLELLQSGSLVHRPESTELCRCWESADVMEENLIRSASDCQEHPNCFSNGVVSASRSLPLLTDEDNISQREASDETDQGLEIDMMDSQCSKRKVFEEVVKRWQEEDNAMEAKCKAKALERLCVKEITQRKEMEELLTREKQEAQRMKNQYDEFMKELQIAKEHKVTLQSQIAESQSTVKELEEKIISAVELLISFKKKRDEMRAKHENAARELKGLRKLVKGEATSFCGKEILEFSFMEINNATHNFDPSWKIGDGKYGSVYKGFLQHVHVAIKMFPSYGSQSHMEFENEVEVLSRVRHPNLVTLIGTCPESRSLVYEYLRNGSLEDRLACKNKAPPLPWQTRTCIAFEICSALVFLHANKPCIIHGNLKPSKVLLDINFVCKLTDYGFCRLIPQDESPYPSATSHDKSNTNVTAVYMDPEYLETGKVTPESDVYSFGMILLQLLTGRPVLGILKDVKSAIEKDNFNTLLDASAGDWPLAQAKRLAHLALWCCEREPLDRPDLASEVWGGLEKMRNSCITSSSCLGMKECRRIPSHFVCPIAQDIMQDPHIAADGFTYEGEAIREWLESDHKTSPMTNLKLEHCNLLPNYALHQAIQEWQQKW